MNDQQPSDEPEHQSGGETDARFTTGSTMRHVIAMTAAGAIGLLAIFLVDLADLYFLSLLGEVEVAAAIGYAGTVLFFTTSVAIGLAIAATALVSRSIGRGEAAHSKRLTVHAHIFALIISTILAVMTWILVPSLLHMLGAEGRAHALARSYLWIIVPSMPLLSLGICSSGVLRSLGDGRGAMYVTLAGAGVNGVLDPIFIFGLGLGVDGAAFASVISRFAVLGVGVYGVAIRHAMVAWPTRDGFLTDVSAIAGIAALAVLTNVATPAGNAYVTAALAEFGDGAVAAWAVIGRVIPVAFGAIFALSGAIGPILGQNLGARRFERLSQILSDALLVTVVYVVIVWGLLAFLSDDIARAFNTSGQAREIIRLYCVWIAPLFVFFGALFVANAAFNNLGAAHFSTLLNWSRATIANIPLIHLGAWLFGAPGVIAANMAGAMIFGTLAVAICYRRIARIAAEGEPPRSTLPAAARRLFGWPFNTWRSR